jgi:dihydroorotate dehydrogenase
MGELFNRLNNGETIPFCPAPGAINGLSEEEISDKIIDVAKSPAAAVKWGSTTMNGGSGNDGRTYHHNEKTGISVNSIGLPNIGHTAAVSLQKRMQPQVEAYGKSLIPSFSPGKGEDPLKVLPAMAYGFAQAGAEIIEVNYSCPNKFVDGGQSLEPILGYDLDTMFEIDEAIRAEAGPDITVIRKLPPPVGEKRSLLVPTAEYFAQLEGVALAAFNTIGGQSVLDERGNPALSIGGEKVNIGGLSGRAFGEMAVDGLRRLKQVLPDRVSIFSSVGVDSGYEIYRRVDLEGADCAEGVTVLWENERRGKKFGQTITVLAEQYSEFHEAV